MITRIEIDGFKTFQNFSLDFEPFLAVVGANGAGKSNLFDALALISRLAETDIKIAFQRGRGRIQDQFSLGKQDFSRVICFAVEFLLPMYISRPSGSKTELLHTRFRYEVRIEHIAKASGVEDLVITQEGFRALQANNDIWIRKHPEYKDLARYEQDKPFFGFYVSKRGYESGIPNPSDPGLTGPVFIDQAAGVSRSWLDAFSLKGMLSGERGELPIAASEIAVYEEIRNWRILHLDPFKLHAPSERAAPEMLASDGSNLPTALAALPAETRAQIRADLVDVVPGIRSFALVPVEDEIRIEFEMSDGQRLPARLLSDGTLRVLAILTLLRSARPGSLIAIEEPENGIYPGRLRALIEKMKEAATSDGDQLPLQILLNSHSPAVIAALHSSPENLAFADLVRRRDGLRSTRVRRVQAGASSDRGATVASLREVERLLDSVRPEEVE